MSSVVTCGPLKRVAIAGGTHGDEMSGVYLVKHWIKDPTEICRGTFTTTPFLSNPSAVEKRVRYIDQDLNRSFAEANLTAPDLENDPYEVRRAREINQHYGPRKSESAFDFMIDLHNTTSNMGSCLLVMTPDDHVAMHLAGYLQSHCVNTSSPCRVIVIGEMTRELISLMTVSKHSLALELGPQAQGVVKADILNRMRTLVNCSLDFMELFNKGVEFPSFKMEAYGILERVDYPRDAAGELQAVIHSKLQDNDFLPVNPGHPIFQMLSGEDILYEGESPMYPVFINEAAYYEKKVAYVKMNRQSFSVPAIRMKKD